MIKVHLVNNKGERIEEVEVPESVSSTGSAGNVIPEVIRMYRSRRRRGTASTRGRSEVSYSGRKVWRQKGTGRARAGDRGNPLWRHGGVIFGPKPRDFSVAVPKRVKRKALASTVAIRLQKEMVLLIDDWGLKEPRTKLLAEILDRIGAGEKPLLVTARPDPVLRLAARNIPGIEVSDVSGLNAYSVLSHRRMIITREAWDHLARWMEKVK